LSPRKQRFPRDRMVEVAGRLFYDQGVRATGVADVIAAVGCGKQALYRLFPTKDELVAAHLETAANQRESSVGVAVNGFDDPSDQLVALIRELAEWVGRPGFRGCALRNYLREYPTEQTRAKAVSAAYVRKSRERVARLAAAARPDDAELVAQQVWLVHEGLYASLDPSPEMRAAAVSLVSDLVAPSGDTPSTAPRPSPTTSRRRPMFS